MTRVRIAASRTEAAPPAAFRRILCAIDGTRSATEAARQATLLAGPTTDLTFIAVADHSGVGATAMADLSPAHASQALASAVQMAAEAGSKASTILAEGRESAELILHAAGDHDLLVLGSPRRSRAEGIALGATASVATHRSTVPVLLARRPPGDTEFPERIVVASDATADSEGLVELAVKIARPSSGLVTLVHTGSRESFEIRHRIAEEAAALYEGLAVEPIVVTDETPAHRAIVAAAERDRASLVITGSHGRRGVAALASVSERVAHTAPCSVLIVRPSHDEAS